MARRIESVGGLLAGLLGVLGLAYATFGPTYRSSTGATRNLIEMNGPQVLAVILVLLLLIASVAVGAYLHGTRRRGLGLVLLWVGATLLALARVITGFSIGVFLQPAAALGLISAVAGSLSGRHPVRGTALGLALFWAGSSLLYFVALARGDTLARVGQALTSGPLFALALLFDPRQLLPLLS